MLADGIAIPGVTWRASRAGAAGIVHVSPHHLLHEMCVSPVWGSPSAETRHELPSVVVVTISNEDGRLLREQMAKGALQLTLHAAVDTGWRKTPLLVAELPPPDDAPDAPFVLLSGHHDTWFEGVMDNGAANVATIEVARICAEQRRRWRRGLRVCVWSGHSQGRYSGSAWYADTHWSELNRRCVAHVNVDSLGAVGADILTNTGSAGGLFDIAAAAIKAESGQSSRRAQESPLLRQLLPRHRHSLGLRQPEQSAASAGQDAQRSRLVVAHGARSDRQDRWRQSRPRHAHRAARGDGPSGRAHPAGRLSPADR